MKIYQLTIEQIFDKLQTNKHGITEHQATNRLKTYGLNQLPQRPKESLAAIFFRQFYSPLILILLIAALINLFSGHRLDTILILFILIINAVIGTFQEGKSQNILQSLTKFIKSEAIVVRDNTRKIIEDKYLVPGDIIVLHDGFKVPADARIIDQEQLIVDESLLTGESVPVTKNNKVITKETEVFDQKNMVFQGTYITSGSGIAVVVATGSNSQIGKINKAIETINIDLPLKSEIKKLSNYILIFVSILCTIIFLVSLTAADRTSIFDILYVLTALLVAVIPESLPIILTLSLAYGAYRMAKQNVLVKRLQAVDALGRVEVMIVDKTGTLTRNEMMVTQVFSNSKFYDVTGDGYFPEGQVLDDNKPIKHFDENLILMAIAGTLTNRAEIDYSKDDQLFKIKGDPTEAAIDIFAQKIVDTNKIKHEYLKIQQFPFTPQTRYHAGFYKKNNTTYLFVVGSPEHVLALCHNNQTNSQSALEKLLNGGLRTVAAAYKILTNLDTNNLKSQINNLNLLGFYGIQDAIREGIEPLINEARNAGLHIVMATGDHKETAMYVASKVGIFRPGDNVINGTEFKDLTQEQLINKLKNTTVCSRVTPENKLTLVKSFQQLNAGRGPKIVSMTGDGVNDVPPILAADVGIAMGLMGTEVTKNAADLILLDDSFKSIIDGIEWGRHIFFTIRRITHYLISTNLGEAFLIAFSLFLNLPVPLTVIQILWINLVTDGFLDIALVFEPKERHLIRKKLNKKYTIVNYKDFIKLIAIGLLISISSLILFLFYNKFYSINHTRTVTMVTVAMFSWFNAWNYRSETKSLFKLNIVNNKWLLVATALVLFLTLSIIYIPALQSIFRTAPITLQDWLVIFIVSSSIIWFEEIRKRYFN